MFFDFLLRLNQVVCQLLTTTANIHKVYFCSLPTVLRPNLAVIYSLNRKKVSAGIKPIIVNKQYCEFESGNVIELVRRLLVCI